MIYYKNKKNNYMVKMKNFMMNYYIIKNNKIKIKLKIKRNTIKK